MLHLERMLFGVSHFLLANDLLDEKQRRHAPERSNWRTGLDFAIKTGVQAVVCSNDGENWKLVDSRHSLKLKIYPCIPDAGLIENFMKESGKDSLSVLKKLVHADMRAFKHLKSPIVFIHFGVSDLLLGLGMINILAEIQDFIKTKYQAEVGIMTMNLPKMVAMLEYVGIHNPLLCSVINKAGYKMQGGRELYEETLNTKKVRAIAMQIRAGGALPVEEAVEYISRHTNIESILFGSESNQSIQAMVSAINFLYNLESKEKKVEMYQRKAGN